MSILSDGTVWPCTLAITRYGGVYEGGEWAAFACLPHAVPEKAFGDDITCGEWWANPTVPVAVGPAPQDAYDALRKTLEEGDEQ